jgi:hypothetical protein
MKKMIKISGCLLFAIIMGLSSCVKNDVAPEVASLRQAQVDKLKAQINQILADASYRNAQTRSLKLEIYFDSLFNVMDLKANTDQYQVTLANIQNRLEIERRFLAQNQLSTAQAVAEYEKFIASGKFQDNVVQLLGKYNNENRVLQQLYSDRITLQEQIAEGNLLLAGITSGLPLDLLKTQLENDLAQKNADLDAAVAALADLEEAYGDPTGVEEQKAALDAEIAGMWADWGELDITRNEADEAYNTAGIALQEAQLAVQLMEDWDALDYVGTSYGNGFVQDEIDILDDSLSYVKDIADANTEITKLNADLALANSTLTALKSALTAANNAYNTQLATYNTLNTAKVNADADVAYKTQLLNVAQQNLDAANAAVPATAPATITSLTTIRDAAQVALTAATTTQTNAGNSLAPATVSKNNAKTTLDNAQIAVTGYANPATTPAPGSPQGIVDGIKSDIDDQNDNIADANANLADVAINLAIVRAKIDEWSDKYDAAVADMPTLLENYATLEHEYMTITLERNRLNSMIQAKIDVLDVLNTHLGNMEDAIAGRQATITDLEEAIADLETAIARNGMDEEWALGRVANLEALLAVTETKITNSEGIVAYWKKLLDEAIAAVSEE